MKELEIKKLFGKRIREFRKYQNLTQEDLAEMLWMDTQHLCKMENGHHFPSLKNLVKIAEVLNVECAELFKMDETEHGKVLRRIHAHINKLNEKELEVLDRIILSILELREI